MSGATIEQLVTQAGDTVDLIAYRRFGASTGYTEAILAANPGLAALGPRLPAGLKIAIPVAKPAPAPQPARLWS